MSLPEFFVVYNPLRKSSSDPYSGLSYVSATNNSGVITLTPLPTQPNVFNINAIPSGKIGTYTHFGGHFLSVPGGEPKMKNINNWSAHFNIRIGDGPQIPVLEITHKLPEHFPHMLKRNFAIGLLTVQTPTPTPTQAPTPIIRKIKPNNLGLNPHVARQLLKLAIAEKTMCPITAEEVSENNTAVMPCGHLFSRIAIEESFKTRSNECPMCRATGHPTLV